MKKTLKELKKEIKITISMIDSHLDEEILKNIISCVNCILDKHGYKSVNKDISKVGIGFEYDNLTDFLYEYLNKGYKKACYYDIYNYLCNKYFALKMKHIDYCIENQLFED